MPSSCGRSMTSLIDRTCIGNTVTQIDDNSLFTKSIHRKAGGSSAVPDRLQRLATALFVTGFAGSVAATRIMAPFNGAAGRLGTYRTDQAHAAFPDELPRHGSPPELQQTRALLVELQALLQAPPTAPDALGNDVRARAREITRSLALIDRAVNQATRNHTQPAPLGMCASPADEAVAFVSTNFTFNNGGKGSFTIEITGNEGSQHFTFASGTSQSSVIAAINTFTKATGIEAGQSDMNPGRVEMTSVDPGADSLIRLRILDGPDLIFAEPIGGPPLGDLKDYGANALVLRAIDDKP